MINLRHGYLALDIVTWQISHWPSELNLKASKEANTRARIKICQNRMLDVLKDAIEQAEMKIDEEGPIHDMPKLKHDRTIHDFNVEDDLGMQMKKLEDTINNSTFGLPLASSTPKATHGLDKMFEISLTDETVNIPIDNPMLANNVAEEMAKIIHRQLVDQPVLALEELDPALLAIEELDPAGDNQPIRQIANHMFEPTPGPSAPPATPDSSPLFRHVNQTKREDVFK